MIKVIHYANYYKCTFLYERKREGEGEGEERREERGRERAIVSIAMNLTCVGLSCRVSGELTFVSATLSRIKSYGRRTL